MLRGIRFISSNISRSFQIPNTSSFKFPQCQMVNRFSTEMKSQVETVDFSRNNILGPKRIKHKIPRKRASSLLATLQKEDLEKLKSGRSYPQFLPGDSISIEMLPYMTAKTPEIVKGVVVGISNRGIDTLIKMLNYEEGTQMFRQIFMYHPLIKSITVLERRFAYRSKKTKRRRAKLYYLENLRPKLFTVK